MLKKANFFKHYFVRSREYNKNLKKTKKIFNSFLIDLKNKQIPLLDSYEKNYEFDFSTATVKKFSKFKNIVIIGMGGSILGTKSIYSFLEKKIVILEFQLILLYLLVITNLIKIEKKNTEAQYPMWD